MRLHFEPVTMENRKQIEALKLYPEQAGYIESVEECLTEADEAAEWKPVGVYDGNDLIGFAMYGYFPQLMAEGQMWLDRFLIDREYQGKGYGKAAVDLLLQRLVTEYGKNKIYLSVYDSNKAAIRLYEKAGFYFNGELDTKGERVMVWEEKSTLQHND